MEVILNEEVVGLGEIGQRVNVKPGYARNYLIPRGLAVEAGTKNARVLKHKMTQIEGKMRRLKGAAEQLGQKVRDLTLTFELRVGESGKVFGSLSTKDIAERLSAAISHPIDRRRVLLADPIKKVGTHFVKVKLHNEVEATLKVIVEQIAATTEQEDAAVHAAKSQIEDAVEAKREAAE